MNISAADLGVKGKVTVASVIACVREGVESGTFKQGAFLPSPHDLASHLGLASEVMVDAYATMVGRGMILSWEAGGTFWAIPENPLQKKLRERLRGTSVQSEQESAETEARRRSITADQVREERAAKAQRNRRFGI